MLWVGGPGSRSLLCRQTGIRILVQAGGTIAVGRRPDCDVVLDRPHIGSRLFWLDNREGRLYLHGLPTRNPLLVNGSALPADGTRELSDGDRVEYGEYCFLVEPLSQSGSD